MKVLELSAKTSQGMDEWFAVLESKLAQPVQASGKEVPRFANAI